jgi:hypothetical protein
MRKLSKLTTVAAGSVAAVALSGIAFAYWSATGSGAGTAGSDTTVPVTVNQTSTITTLAPGLPAASLAGHFDNPNAGPVYISGVTVAIDSVTPVGGGTCDASDYTITQPAAVNAEVPSGTAKGSWSGGGIAFNNKATNQDGCKGATVTLAYTAS